MKQLMCDFDYDKIHKKKKENQSHKDQMKLS